MSLVGARVATQASPVGTAQYTELTCVGMGHLATGVVLNLTGVTGGLGEGGGAAREGSSAGTGKGEGTEGSEHLTPGKLAIHTRHPFVCVKRQLTRTNRNRPKTTRTLLRSRRAYGSGTTRQ